MLCAAILQPQSLEHLPFLKPDHFYSEAHRRIFEAVVELRGAGEPIDTVHVGSHLRTRGRLDQVGGMGYVVTLLNAAPSVDPRHVEAYGRTVEEKSRIRSVIAKCQSFVAEAYHDYGDAGAWLAKVARDLNEATVPLRSTSFALDGATLSKELPMPDYLIESIGLVGGSGAPHLVAGYGYSGKTVALQSMLLSLAAGRAVWGVYATAERRVSHVDLEQGVPLCTRRYQRLAASAGIDMAKLGDRLLLYSEVPLSLVPDQAARWREIMVRRDLLVIDSLKAASPGQDENASDVRAGLDMLGTLSAQTGCRALVIHHARKKAKDDPGGAQVIRGSSGIFDAVDSAYLFSAEKGEPVQVEHVKARSHGELVEDFALVISDEELDGKPRGGLSIRVHGAELLEERREARATAWRQERLERDKDILRRVLRENPGLGARELRAAAKLGGIGGRERLDNALFALGEEVEVRRVEGSTKPSNGHYLRGSRNASN